MPRAVVVTLTNPVAADREQEFNDWYTNVHAPDIAAIEGVASTTRFRLADAQVYSPHGPPPFRYLCLIEIDTEDVDAVFSRLASAAVDGAVGVSTALDAEHEESWTYVTIAGPFTHEAALEIQKGETYASWKPKEMTGQEFLLMAAQHDGQAGGG